VTMRQKAGGERRATRLNANRRVYCCSRKNPNVSWLGSVSIPMTLVGSTR
jgi:hypothetical protein